MRKRATAKVDGYVFDLSRPEDRRRLRELGRPYGYSQSHWRRILKERSRQS